MELRSADIAGILYPSAADVPRKGRRNALRVCSWNMNEGAFADSNETPVLAADTIVEFVRSAEIDLLVLQEVPMDASGTSEVTASVAASSGLRYVGTTMLSAGYVTSTHSGIGVLSKVPLSNQRLFQLPNPGLSWDDGITASFDKGLVAYDLRFDEYVIVISAIHGFPFHRFDRSADESAFRGIWDYVVGAIDDVAERNAAIVVGDFNTSNRKLITTRTKREYLSIMGGIVTHGDRAADDILISRDLSLVGGPYAVWSLSDHLVCIADISPDDQGL